MNYQSYKSIREAERQFDNDRIDYGRTVIYFFVIATILGMLLFFGLGCSDDNTDPIQVIVTSPPVEPPVIEPPPENNPIQLSLWTSAGLKFYDGESIFEWKTGTTARAESGTYSHENVLYYLDEYGQESSSISLVTEADLIAVDGDDYYLYEHIDPQSALDMGAMYKDYSRFYMNNTEVGSWGAQDYIVDKIHVVDGELFARKTNKSWVAITGAKTQVKYVNNHMVIYDYDIVTHTAKINSVSVNWSTNFLNGAKYWQKSGAKYYTENGYTWDGVTLDESTGIMSDWRVGPFLTGYTEGPVLISAGTRTENSEQVLYWIECNSGWVVRHITSTNQMTLHVRLYSGDGVRTTGLFYQDLLKTVIVGDYLYFIWEAQVYRYDFISWLNAVFTSGVSEIWGY